MSEHAVLASSKAATWLHCIGSAAACAGLPNTTSVYAEEGTAAHAVGAGRLQGQPLPAVDAETSDFINVYVNAVKNAAEGKILLVEQRVNIGPWTSEKGAKGTADALIIDLAKSELQVWDLKFGMGHVVYAPGNEQLRLYALGALELAELMYGPMKSIRLMICQPRRDHMSEDVMTREELMIFGERTRNCGEMALELVGKSPAEFEPFLSPSESACLWCPAKATCPALRKAVTEAVFEEFTTTEAGAEATIRKVGIGDVPTAGLLDLIGDWVKAQRDWIDENLRAGLEVPGWKLVLGRRGSRKFSDLKKVEELLKSLKFKKKQIYEESLIPLTKIQKLVPTPKWPVFEALITQAPAQPIAVDASDKRPEFTSKLVVADFQNEEFDAFN